MKNSILKGALAICALIFLQRAAICQSTFEQYYFGGNGTITIDATTNCAGGLVTFKFFSNRKLRDVEVSYDGSAYEYLHLNSTLTDGVGNYHTSNVYADGLWYTWDKIFTNYSNSATIQLKFDYEISPGIWCNCAVSDPIMGYTHIGTNSDPIIDFNVSNVGPQNLVEVIYTGTDPLASGTGVTSYDFVLNYDLNSVVYQNPPSYTGVWLGNGSIIGSATQNPHFYCNTGSVEFPTIKLLVHLYRTYTNSQGQQSTMMCSSSQLKAIEVEDLCAELNTSLTESVPPNEFSMEVTTSDPVDPLLDPFISDITVNFGDGTVIQQLNPGQSQYHSYSSTVQNPYQGYQLTETVTFEGGCNCSSNLTYDPGDPCNNMGIITISYIFDENTGQYIYTLSPSTYAGSNPNADPMTMIKIDWGDGSPIETFYPPFNITHVYLDDGNYNIVQQTYFGGDILNPCPSYLGGPNDDSGLFPHGVEVSTYCCENFAPDDGKSYWISAWVKEDQSNQVKTYSNTSIEIEFLGLNPSTINFYPSGDIIEGWQRIVGKFLVPIGSESMKLHLVNNDNSIDAYFDDVRVHPFNASMKSYVYDPETLWLTAELDDNNYATFYEYDKEGQLIRIKKETSRGIMTIQESRSSNAKIID